MLKDVKIPQIQQQNKWLRGHFRIILLALILSMMSSNISATFDPNLMCSLLMNGTKIKDPRACNTWIECIDGQPITGICANGDFYDRSTMACVPPESITCISSDPCAATAGTNGFVADPYSCNGYYYCNGVTAAHGECNAGMNFNPGTQDCIRNFPCATKMDPDSYCNIVPDSVFIKNSDNCNGYQMCWKGAIINGTCPDNFYYNPKIGSCDYPKDVDCVEVVTNPPNMPIASDVCTQAGDFVSDNYACNGYYLCYKDIESGELELIHGTCPIGRFFDASNGGSCIARTQIACSFDRCVNLGSTGIELSNLSDDNCQGYGICQDGALIGDGKCPQNQYFDETQQRCTTEVISYPACASSPTFVSDSTTSIVDTIDSSTVLSTQATTTKVKTTNYTTPTTIRTTTTKIKATLPTTTTEMDSSLISQSN